MSSSDSSFSVITLRVSKHITPHHLKTRVGKHIPSSFFSSFFSSFASAGAAAPLADAAGAAAAAAGAAEPPPVFMSISLTSLPSRALAKRVVQMGSTSGTLAAVIIDWSLSA